MIERDSTRPETKQVLVLDGSAGMSRGKLVAQGAHQAVANVVQDAEIVTHDGRRGIFIPTDEYTELEDWLAGAFTKICLKAPDLAAIMDIHRQARQAGLRVTLITDAGRTEFGKPTVTGVGIGPHIADKIDPITGHLPLYK